MVWYGTNQEVCGRRQVWHAAMAACGSERFAFCLETRKRRQQHCVSSGGCATTTMIGTPVDDELCQSIHHGSSSSADLSLRLPIQGFNYWRCFRREGKESRVLLSASVDSKTRTPQSRCLPHHSHPCCLSPLLLLYSPVCSFDSPTTHSTNTFNRPLAWILKSNTCKSTIKRSSSPSGIRPDKSDFGRSPAVTTVVHTA